jgi:hypothetical protein
LAESDRHGLPIGSGSQAHRSDRDAKASCRGPITAIIEGILMQRFGFKTMFSWTSLTCLVGIVLFFFARDTRKHNPITETAG